MANDKNPERKTHTRVDTICFTRADVEKWKKPPFQRELKTTQKVVAIAEEIKANGGVLPGVITLARFGGDIYRLDGQHRCAAFLMTDLKEGYADVRICTFDSMSEMAKEYIDLNSHLVPMKPDDFLRGFEKIYPPLAYIKNNCPFVGYDMIRRGERSPILSMSILIRTWMGSAPEVPKTGVGSAAHVAPTVTMEDAKTVVRLLNLLYSAWGRGDDTKRLWSTLNLILCFWLYRRLVLSPPSTIKRAVKLTEAEFEKAMMSLGANAKYHDWLAGRNFNERDRSPAFARVKEIIARRLMELRGLAVRPLLPAPAWATHGGTHGTLT